jgi:hypothetical protein
MSFDAGKSGETAWNADRAAAVSAERKRCNARGDGRRRAGARPARRLAEIPGIARYSGERAIADRLAAEFAGRGLADQNGAGCLSALNGGRVDHADIFCHRARAGCIGHAGDRHQVLGRERNAVQRPERQPPHDGVLGRLGCLQSPLRQQDEKGVQSLLRRFRFCQSSLGQLDRRYVLADNPAPQLRRCRIVKLGAVRTCHRGLRRDKAATLNRPVSC